MEETLTDSLRAAGASAIALAMTFAISTPCAAQVAGAGLPTFGIAAPQVTPGVDQLRFGPSLEAGYDSNVARTSASVAAQRGITPEDFFVLPSGEIAFSRAFGRETIFLNAQAGFQAYARNSVLNRENIAIEGGGEGQVGICQTTLSGAYTRAQADLSYLILQANGQLAPGVKDARQDSIIDLTATCGQSIGFSPTANVSETWLTNSAPLYQLLDAHEFSGSGGILYRNPVLGQVSITGQYSNIEYPNRLVPVLGPTGIEAVNYAFRTLGGGVTYLRQVGRLTGTVALNYEKLEPAVSVAVAGFSGLTYDVDLTYALTPRMNVTALVGKATTPSNELQSSFSITQLYGVQANYSFTSQMSAQVGYSRSHQQYGGFLTPVVNNITEQTTNTLFGSVTRKVNRWLNLESSLTYARRETNFNDLNYSDVRLIVSASTFF